MCSPNNAQMATTAWFASGAVTVFLPLLVMVIGRATNEWEGGEQQQNGGDNNNNGEDRQYSAPWWYFGRSSNRERREDDTPPILIAVYLWSLLVFGGILFYGYRTIARGGDYTGIVAALVLFANYAVLSMFLFGGIEGAIETEGRAVEEHGFVGQFGVMMYITSILWAIFSIVFAFVFRHRLRHQNVTKIEVDAADYQIHKETHEYTEEPTIQHSPQMRYTGKDTV